MSRTAQADRKCEKNIRTITEALGTDEEHAYAMILLTAALMDYAPWDERVADVILRDGLQKAPVTA